MIQIPYSIILASNSPRRQELLAGLDIDFNVFVKKDIDESHPEGMANEKVAEYLALKKANVYRQDLKDDVLVITADTIVINGTDVLGKPKDKEEAIAMINTLSGNTHIVITGVAITSNQKQYSFSALTEVTFAPLTAEEIEYYVEKYKPYDKAGSYGIQEWIGYIGIESISGSYFNVMGLPTRRLYDTLKNEFSE